MRRYNIKIDKKCQIITNIIIYMLAIFSLQDSLCTLHCQFNVLSSSLLNVFDLILMNSYNLKNVSSRPLRRKKLHLPLFFCKTKTFIRKMTSETTLLDLICLFFCQCRVADIKSCGIGLLHYKVNITIV